MAALPKPGGKLCAGGCCVTPSCLQVWHAFKFTVSPRSLTRHQPTRLSSIVKPTPAHLPLLQPLSGACPSRRHNYIGNRYCQVWEVHIKQQLHASSDLPGLAATYMDIIFGVGMGTCEWSTLHVLRKLQPMACQPATGNQPQGACLNAYFTARFKSPATAHVVPKPLHQLGAALLAEVARGKVVLTPQAIQRGFDPACPLSMLVRTPATESGCIKDTCIAWQCVRLTYFSSPLETCPAASVPQVLFFLLSTLGLMLPADPEMRLKPAQAAHLLVAVFDIMILVRASTASG